MDKTYERRYGMIKLETSLTDEEVWLRTLTALIATGKTNNLIDSEHSFCSLSDAVLIEYKKRFRINEST